LISSISRRVFSIVSYGLGASICGSGTTAFKSALFFIPSLLFVFSFPSNLTDFPVDGLLLLEAATVDGLMLDFLAPFTEL
jgi:hypothetical protein